MGDSGRYDLVVIGGGTAGLVSAAGAAAVGARVALVERDRMGGDCLNTGCVPSKAFIRSARAAADARRSGAFGVTGAEDAGVDFPAVVARMRRLRDSLGEHDSVRRFADDLGVEVILAEGRFTGRDRVDAAGRTLRFRKAAICTGARAALPPVAGLADAGCLTNETVFDLEALPARLLVIGAGPVGCELAQAFARFGSRVTLVTRGLTLLPKEDPDASRILREAFARDGIEVVAGGRIEGVRKEGEGVVATVALDGVRREIRADRVLAGVGRLPNVEGLGLEAAGVAWEAGAGVKVDDRLRTSNHDVYAAGDVCSLRRYTHVADAHARILVGNALFPGWSKVSALIVPRCTYTDPEVAHVGLSEAEAAARGIATTVLTVPMADVDRAVLDGETGGFARVILGKGSDRILGATVVAAHAGEMIGEMALAVTARLGLSAVGRTIHPYPTQSEAFRKLADAYNRSRLTPAVARILAGWLRWRRG